MDKTFPLHLWCHLLDQAELTLNMLHTSRINPNLSAHKQLHGMHDFNATPLAPPGTKCIAHEKSSQRGTWAPHGQHGWYVGAAPKHYRCYQIYIPKTQGTQICDTVEFFPTHCKMPKVSAHDAAIYAANDLITALTKPQPTNSFISIVDDQLVALRQFATIFQTSITKKTNFRSGGARHCTPHPPPPSVHVHAAKPRNLRMLPLQHHNALRYSTHNPSQPLTKNKRRTWSLTPFPCNIQHYNKPRIIPIIANLCPQYPTKHEGLLEDPFPLIQSANSVTDPDTGKQLEYKQLINHPDSNLHQTWQRLSANEFGRLAQGVGRQIKGTETIKFLHYHEMPKNWQHTYAHFVCDV